MKRLTSVLVGVLGLTATAAGQDLSGHWTGGLPQDDRTFVFTMQVDIQQVGNKLSGTSRLTDNQGTWSIEEFSGTVTAKKVFLQESKVLRYKPGTVNNWCVKTLVGVVKATTTTLTITGTWTAAPPCAPGQFTISKAVPPALPPVASVRRPTSTPAASPADSVVVNKKVVLQNVLFERTKAVLLPASQADLNNLVDVLAARPALSVVIDGHADKIGSAAKNLTLSQQRAQEVKRYLVAHGIGEARISTTGYGDTRPICPPPCPANQRVEFTLLLAE